ncbi:unnamed protein product [Prunus brigantina]
MDAFSYLHGAFSSMVPSLWRSGSVRVLVLIYGVFLVKSLTWLLVVIYVPISPGSFVMGTWDPGGDRALNVFEQFFG